MRAYTRNMRQAATYWPPGQNDGFGGVTYGDPVPVQCRWEDKAEQFRDSEGEEATSSAVVYVDRQLGLNGYIALGEYANGPIDAGARQIRQRFATPSLDGRRVLHKVML